ncbi:MAG: TrkH family potassium uptake protein [Candidatus Bipolaricaulota bacterium]|nr:MAG: TrkH family potassium uptake protein [Candidatus Bipolaricaulota bacterium]
MTRLSTIAHYFGIVLIVFAFLQALPLLVSALSEQTVEFPSVTYGVPAAVSLLLGALLTRLFRPRELTSGQAMAVGVLAWVALSLIGAVPLWIALDFSYLDMLFESVSGFTTTGMTIILPRSQELSPIALNDLPDSLLVWRALTQWIGGLGIFTLFLAVTLRGGARHNLLAAEVHKAASGRPVPGLLHSLRILWALYVVMTAACAAILMIFMRDPVDAVVHALTALSTGGFSTYDASVGHFSAGPHAAAIEYTLIVFMFLGGTSFLIHWNVIRGRWRQVTANRELRLWLLLLLGATFLVAVRRGPGGDAGLHERIRSSLFHVVSIATTTGYTTHDIGSAAFSGLAQQVFLWLMLIGGCVGSTAGGAKVWRLGLLLRVMRHHARRAVLPSSAVVPLVYDGAPVPRMEVTRTATVMFSWIVLLAVGSVVLSATTSLSVAAALSGSFSSLGNVGPSLITVDQFAELGAAAKLWMIFAMIAGRLEILPVLLLVQRRAWR